MTVDKRSQARVNSEGIVYYSDAIEDEESEFHEEKYKGQVVDISPAGICFTSKHEYIPGSKVQFDIYRYYKGTYRGVVRRCVKNKDSYHVGLEVPFGMN